MKKKEIILNNLERYLANPKQVMIELSNTLNTSKSYVYEVMQKEIKMRHLEAVEKARKELQERFEREKFENKSTGIPIDFDHCVEPKFTDSKSCVDANSVNPAPSVFNICEFVPSTCGNAYSSKITNCLSFVIFKIS